MILSPALNTGLSLKGIVRFFYAIRYFVGIFLFSDIFLDYFLIDTDRAHIVPLTPEMPAAKFVFEVSKLFENHE
jgi:hypothetical protein